MSAAPVDVPIGARGGLLRESFAAASHEWATRIGLILVAAVVTVALLGPFLAPHSQSEFVGLPFAPPSEEAKLGTDTLGRDVLSRTLGGGRSLLWMPLLASALAIGLGTLLGVVAAYVRPALDGLIMRTIDLVLAFPMIVLVLLVVSVVGPRMWLVVLMVGLGLTPGVARVSRGATQTVARHEFIEAAEAMGVSRRRIVVHEILPNISTPLLVEAGIRFAWSIGIIAGISFLGFGMQPPASDWGLMINENHEAVQIQPYAVIVPATCVVLLAIGSNLIAEGLARTIAGVDRASEG